MAADVPANDVWSTINHGFDVAASYFQARAATHAAPSPNGTRAAGANPFPGTQGPYPQAEAKPSPGGSALAQYFSGAGGLLLLALGALLLVGLLRR